jgi:protoporphyrinogen oxidase
MSRKQTRRQFLKAFGGGAAAGACLPLLSSCPSSVWNRRLRFSGAVVGEDLGPCHAFRDGTLKPEVGNPEAPLYDVIIVGGGISGLAAAWKFARSGLPHFLLIEKADEIGGTCIAGEENGLVFSWGAHYIESPRPTSPYLLEIGEDLGLIVDYDGAWPVVNPQYLVPGPEVNLLAGGKWGNCHFPMQIANSQDVVEFEAFRQDLYRWVQWRDKEGRPAFGCPLETTSPAEEVRRLDGMSMLAYVRSQGFHSELLDWHINDRMMDEYGVRMSDVSAWAGIQFWAQSNSDFTDFEPPGTPAPQTLSWPEGNAFLARGLAKRLTPRQLRCNAWVVHVRNEGERVLVTCAQGDRPDYTTLQARWLIYAAPKPAVYHVIPELERAGRTEFHKCQYAAWLVANVHLRRPPRIPGRAPAWETLACQSWGVGYINARHLERHPDRANQPTVLTFYAPLGYDLDTERYELLKEGWEFWARLVLQALEEMHPDLSELITRIDLYKWGHAMPVMRPGYLWGPDRERMKRPCGRIHFAHSDVGGTPVFEQAAYRGIETAERVLDALGKSYRSSL